MPSCVVQVLGRLGELERVVPVSLPRRVMIHDAAVTERFVVVADVSLHFSLPHMLTGDRMPFRLDEHKPVRFGLLPVDARDYADVQWIPVDAPGFFIMHMVNAYDDGDKVVLHTLVLRDFAIEMDGMDDYGTSTLHKFELGTISGTCTMSEIPLRGEVLPSSWRQAHSQAHQEHAENPGQSKAAREQKPSETMLLFEMPTVSAPLEGREAQFAYMLGAGVHARARMPALKSIVKVDLLAGRETGRIELDDCGADDETDIGCGKCQFVPRSDAQSEDDGYLLTVTVSQPHGRSALRVFDARTMSPTPVAVVHAPFRLPMAFHTIFVPEEEE